MAHLCFWNDPGEVQSGLVDGMRISYAGVVVSVFESIVKNLEGLPAPKLVEVAHYVSGLNPKRREARLAAIKATAGCMSGDEGDIFERLVRLEANRVDADGGG